jgi:hypothetical protein
VREPIVRRLLAAWLLAAAAPAALSGETKNWFDDPYFQVRNAVAGCPVPRGPLIDEADMRREAHARVERGTSCWLAGRCAKANAYHYDAGIADAVRQRFSDARVLPRASLWVTVQRRIVWVEGCVATADADRRIERLLHGVPDVEQMVVNLARRPGDRPPYAVRDPATR